MTPAKGSGLRAQGWIPNVRGLTLLLALSAQPFALSSAACTRAPRSTQARAKNLVLITIDKLRADHVGAYGWTRARTGWSALRSSTGSPPLTAK